MGFANPAGVVALVKAGRLKGIAVTGDKCLDALTQVPTFAESGLPGLVLRNWYAITAPARPPKAVIDILSATTAKISAMQDVKTALNKQGLDSFTANTEQMEAIRREDMAIVGKVIKAGNIRLQESTRPRCCATSIRP